jgi:hypothetical protein
MKAVEHFVTAVSYTISELSLVSQYLAPVDIGCLLELDFPLWVSVHPTVSRREVVSNVANAASFIQKILNALEKEPDPGLGHAHCPRHDDDHGYASSRNTSTGSTETVYMIYATIYNTCYTAHSSLGLCPPSRTNPLESLLQNLDVRIPQRWLSSGEPTAIDSCFSTRIHIRLQPENQRACSMDWLKQRSANG